MALTKERKKEVVDQISELLSSSKMTVVARYQGASVKAMQELRKQAGEGGTKVKVAKNRLVIKALQANDRLKDIDTSALNGMLLYAFNTEDEVAPAQSLNAFAKTNPELEFVGAITPEGKFLSTEEVKALAQLPSKSELVAQVIATLSAPLNDTISGLGGNLHALLDGIEAKANA